MNSYVIALGSNQGNRLAHLHEALKRLSKIGSIAKVSPALENPPWLPDGAPASWFSFFLNAAIIVETSLSPVELLLVTQQIEKDLGRPADHPAWSPRTIDIDILFELSGTQANHPHLQVPHPQWEKRNFVLAPLSHILPAYKSSSQKTVLELYRKETKKLPSLMAIVNVTPDSFSQKKKDINNAELFENLTSHFKSGVAYIDIGAESTRPGAHVLSPDEEWERLEPILSHVRELKKDYPFTQVSLDSYHAKNARRALDYNVDILNDVRGLEDEAMQEVAGNYKNVVVMHSLTVPADKNVNWPENIDPVKALQRWIDFKFNSLSQVKPENLLWDPGFGFGKTPAQSLALIQKFEAFKNLPLRSVVGHSRKSFMNLWTEKPFKDRDPETLILSNVLTEKGADILRVHNIPAHLDFFKAQMTMQSDECLPRSQEPYAQL